MWYFDKSKNQTYCNLKYAVLILTPNTLGKFFDKKIKNKLKKTQTTHSRILPPCGVTVQLLETSCD